MIIYPCFRFFRSVLCKSLSESDVSLVKVKRLGDHLTKLHRGFATHFGRQFGKVKNQELKPQKWLGRCITFACAGRLGMHTRPQQFLNAI